MYCSSWKRYCRLAIRCNIPFCMLLTLRNKLLVKAVEVARGSHLTAQKKAVEGMDVWKRLNDERVEISEEGMDIDG